MSPRGLYYLLGLVLIVPDAVADAKLGETCSVTIPCISRYACDVTQRKCLATPGHECNKTTDCVSYASCLNNTCYCNSGFRPYSSGLCDLDNGLQLLGEPCSEPLPCMHDGVGCNDTPTCYVCDRVTDRCAMKGWSPCVTSTECVSHSTCDDFYGCVCDSGYTLNDAGLCGADTGGSLGDYCSSQTPCLSGYVCKDNTFHGGVGTTCSDSLQCANGTCDSEQKKCLLPQYYRCETSASCVSNAMCTNHGHCMCNSGYTPNEIGLCTAAQTATTPTATAQTSTAPTTSPASVGNSTHAVEGTTIGNTCYGQRNKGLRLTMVWIPNGLLYMTGVLLVGL